MRSTIRWGATHGLMRAAIRRQARAGNIDARLLADDASIDPFEHYEALRADRPFARGAFARVTVHHDVCTEVLRSDDFGVVAQVGALPRPVRMALSLAGPPPHLGPIDPPSMLAVDPPDHARYRRLVSRAFTAKAVAALRERTATIAGDLLDEIARSTDGTVDLVERYASLLPVTVISEMLGVPTEMRERFLAWGDGAAASLDMGLSLERYREVQDNVAALNEWMRGHLRRLRQEPGDDLISRLATMVDDDGSCLTETEVGATALLVLAAGFETTVNLIGNGAALLFAHPSQRELLAADPSLWPGAVDEILRFDSPVQRTARRARRDTVVAGSPVPEGALVITLLAAANRDPRVFTDPDHFDVTRSNARDHVAFSSGVHYCLGAALARMEGEVALRSLFERFSDLQPAGPATRRPTRILQGYATLPVQARARERTVGS